MSDAIDPKEAKILSDILALVLDEQSGASEAALQKLREKAQGDRVTAGALKNLFARLSGPAPELDGLRDTATNQAAAIRQLQQQLRIERAALQAAIDARDDLADRVANRSTLLRLVVCMGVVAAVLAAGFIGWHYGYRTAVLALPVPPPMPVHDQPPGSILLVPPIRDPSDTAPPPAYPPEAKARGEHGVVALLVHIDAEGHVTAIGVTETAGADLDVAAQQAVREWRFRPAMRDGRPVPSQITLRFSFVLSHTGPP